MHCWASKFSRQFPENAGWRRDRSPSPINVRLGVSDGKATEMLKGDLQAGQEIILGVEEGSLNKAAKPSRPFGMGM